ncbi:HPr family phosphocarrier protein [Pseudoroseicyclus aestuarii]|uniref:Phosphocarrier protein n=1 Tax=Pseudoroseicyclus aestuarii TaxID=1795041 RepID=A0A318T9T2_9RHOB|nr:HPr family phosphocarrier protein [Pseudoroseicyclus aestuarii]PYE85078.1 phosphocarrier protein [Pseudoroseicyclus aestuarii]
MKSAQATHRTLTIVNVKGLHARASAKLVELCEDYEAEAVISRDGMSSTGDSIMGLLMLGAGKGSTIDVVTSGPQAQPLAEAIEALVAARFGEDD